MGAMAQASQLGVAKVVHFGSERQKARWLPSFATGELLPTIAVTEPESGGHVLGMSSTAVRDGSSYVSTAASASSATPTSATCTAWWSAPAQARAGSRRSSSSATARDSGSAPREPRRSARLQLRRADLRGLPRARREPDRRRGPGHRRALLIEHALRPPEPDRGGARHPPGDLRRHGRLLPRAELYGEPLAKLPTIAQKLGDMRLTADDRPAHGLPRVPPARPARSCDAELMIAKLIDTESALTSARPRSRSSPDAGPSATTTSSATARHHPHLPGRRHVRRAAPASRRGGARRLPGRVVGPPGRTRLRATAAGGLTEYPGRPAPRLWVTVNSTGGTHMLHHLDRRAARLIALSLAVSAIAWLAAQPAPAAAHPGPPTRRRHTGRPRTFGVPAPRRASSATSRRPSGGYTATGECAQDPKYGGMGIHYANEELIADGKLDVPKPEILVYQPKGQRQAAARRGRVLPGRRRPGPRHRRRPARRCSTCRSTARCSATTPGCRSTTTCTSGSTATTPRAVRDVEPPLCTALTPGSPRASERDSNR